MIREEFIQNTIEKLGNNPIDYSQKLGAVRQSSTSPFPSLAASVILPLSFNSHDQSSEQGESEFSFHLIKRSKYVSQAGDLGCPGGILHSHVDSLLGILVRYRIIPILRNRAGILAKQRGPQTYNVMLLCLANAIRESWEEVGLNPFQIKLLGPLPTYSLHEHKRIIFPFACGIAMSYNFRLNREVERIVNVPVSSFLHKENYRRLIFETEKSPYSEYSEAPTQPCLVCRDEEGKEEILWGATFSIIVSFLRIASAFEMPEWQTSRIIIKKRNANQLTETRKR
jgi:8-oxo-dGTP pyrophosphatase MutT (NUDIX family)